MRAIRDRDEKRGGAHRRNTRNLDNGRVVIFMTGTGSPFLDRHDRRPARQRNERGRHPEGDHGGWVYAADPRRTGHDPLPDDRLWSASPRG